MRTIVVQCGCDLCFAHGVVVFSHHARVSSDVDAIEAVKGPMSWRNVTAVMELLDVMLPLIALGNVREEREHR